MLARVHIFLMTNLTESGGKCYFLDFLQLLLEHEKLRKSWKMHLMKNVGICFLYSRMCLILDDIRRKAVNGLS